MKERPILFSAEMVRAILDGRKTQTRRVVKPQPPNDWAPKIDIYAPILVDKRTGMQYPGPEVFGASDESFGAPCPYGQPGDRLWVKETFGADASVMEDMHIKYAATPERVRTIGPGAGDVPDGGLPLYYRMIDKAKTKGHAVTFPSIFMPRWASRITLEIAAVRVERLQDISEADAIAEGVVAEHTMPINTVTFEDGNAVSITDYYVHGVPKAGDFWLTGKVAHVSRTEPTEIYSAVENYRRLWTRINGASGPRSWSANPWVWVIEFRKV